MNDKFDELTKSLAQSVTRRGALKKFGVGLAAIALAALGLPERASADPNPKKCLPSGFRCRNKNQCCSRLCIDSICE
jgi:hypothetical protein